MSTAPIIPAIDDDDYDTAQALVVSILAGRSPALNLTPGSAIDGLVVTNEAYLAAVWQAELTQLSNSFSLSAIAANIATVADSFVDSLVSNYFIRRQVAAAASGPVSVITNIAVPYNIPSGFQFSFNGALFATTQNWIIFPPSTTLTDTTSSRVMTKREDGTFEFTLPATATVAGAAGALAAGTTLVITNPLNGMQSASVATDFIGGANQETNAQLLARAQQGITAQVIAGPSSIQAIAAAEFPGITTSVVGLGDPLMVRDRYSLLPISTGGKQDIWCRTTATPDTTTITVNGTVVNATTRTITLTVPYESGIGVYSVPYVRPHGAVILGGFVPAVTVNIYPNTAYQPLVKTSLDAAFTASQILVLSFIDTLTPGALTVGQVISYDVDLVSMPSIEAVTAFLTSQAVRMAGQDILIRAAVPAAVSVTATLRVPAAGAQPNILAIQQAVAAAINAIPFNTASLSTYTVHSAIATVLGTAGSVIDTSLRASIAAPSGMTLTLVNAQQLTLPLDPINLVGPKNTFWCCQPSAVQLQVVAS